MVPLLLVLLLALILFGAGFAVKILWWIAIAVLVVWLRSASSCVPPTRAVVAVAGTDGDAPPRDTAPPPGPGHHGDRAPGPCGRGARRPRRSVRERPRMCP